MSKALKCDCCGKCFDRFNKEGTHIHISELFIIGNSKIVNAKEYERERYYQDMDFCPECTERLETWFTVKE